MQSQMLDVRLARLEGAYEQVNERMRAFDLHFDRLETKIDTNRAHTDRQFFWTIGLIVVSILLPLVTRLI
jgi:hypothetical protein